MPKLLFNWFISGGYMKESNVIYVDFNFRGKLKKRIDEIDEVLGLYAWAGLETKALELERYKLAIELDAIESVEAYA